MLTRGCSVAVQLSPSVTTYLTCLSTKCFKIPRVTNDFAEKLKTFSALGMTHDVREYSLETLSPREAAQEGPDQTGTSENLETTPGDYQGIRHA